MKHILALALMALSIIVQGQEKIFVGTANDGDGDDYYIYPSSIKKSSYGITVWEEWVLAKPLLDEDTNKYYTSSKAQKLIDCNGYRSALIAITVYSKNGNVVNSGNQSEWQAYTELEPKAPGTVAWRIIEETCRIYNRGY